MLLRLAAALLLGAAVGLERSLAGKVAGMRTYALVSLGSALFVLVAQTVTQNYAEIGLRNFDPLRVASQVVVGVGFLGAGLIVLRQDKVRGLTTAAGLWVSAGVGLAAGYGLYTLAVLVSVLMLLVFTLFWYIEQKLASGREDIDPEA